MPNSTKQASRPTLVSIRPSQTPDETPDLSHLGEYKSQIPTRATWYVDRDEGQLRGPALQTTDGEEGFKEWIAGETALQVMVSNNGAFLPAVLADFAEGKIATDLTKRSSRGQYEFFLPAQHVPHATQNWGHVKDEEVNAAFTKALAEGKFQRHGIDPIIAPLIHIQDAGAARVEEFVGVSRAEVTQRRATGRPALTERDIQTFWLDCLYACEDYERMDSYGNNWSMINYCLEAVIETPSGVEQKITSAGLGGVEDDSSKEYFAELAGQELPGLLSDLDSMGVVVRRADVESLGAKALGAYDEWAASNEQDEDQGCKV